MPPAGAATATALRTLPCDYFYVKAAHGVRGALDLATEGHSGPLVSFRLSR